MQTLDWAEGHWFITGHEISFEQATTILLDMEEQEIPWIASNIRDWLRTH